MTFPILARRGRGGGILRFFFRVIIYDICITGISNALGVSRMVGLFIFLGIVIGLSVLGYVIKQRMSPGVDE